MDDTNTVKLGAFDTTAREILMANDDLQAVVVCGLVGDDFKMSLATMHPRLLPTLPAMLRRMAQDLEHRQTQIRNQ